MTERSAPDAVTACPFVAFVDDRDERADVPDHRHRCYAEIRPAPRALAHQQAFCLSAGFAACPTFQDWARREAARAHGAAAASQRGTGDRETDEPVEAGDRPTLDEAVIEDLPPGDDAFEDQVEEPFDDRATRNPRRGWAAPPPWVDPTSADRPEPGAPSFLAGQPDPSDAGGAVPSAGLSSSRWLQDLPPPRVPGDDAPPVRADDDELERALAEDRANRERAAIAATAAAATASGSRAARKLAQQAAPPTVSSARRRAPAKDVTGPSWERPRRYEAYPTLKTRIGLPSIPRLGVAALAILVAAAVLFFLPFVLRLGGDQGGGAAPTPSSSAAASQSVAPTEPPAPTAQVYVLKAGDTLTKVAKRFGLTLDQLLAANKQIKDPNKVKVGDEITIPIAAPSEVVNGASPSASP